MAHRARHLARWTGAGTRRQINLEILLGEMGPRRSLGHFGDQSAPGGKLLAGAAIPIGRIGDNCPDRPDPGTDDPLPTDRTDLISCPPSGPHCRGFTYSPIIAGTVAGRGFRLDF